MKWDKFPLILEVLNRFLNEEVDQEVADAYLNLCCQEIQKQLDDLTIDPKIIYDKEKQKQPEPKFEVIQIENTFSGTFDFGRKVSCTLTRHCALCDTSVRIVLPKLPEGMHWVRDIGPRLIKNYELDIGGNRWSRGYDFTIICEWVRRAGGYAKHDHPGMGYFPTQPHAPDGLEEVIVPLFLDKIIASPHPMIDTAEYRVHIEVPTIADLVRFDDPEMEMPFPFLLIQNAYLLTDYATDYKPEMRQQLSCPTRLISGVEYIQHLIRQTQHTGDEIAYNNSPKIKLAFNHSCHYLFFTVKNRAGADIPITNAKLQVDGYDLRSSYSVTELKHTNWMEAFNSCPYENIYCIPLMKHQLNPIMTKHIYRHTDLDLPPGLNFSTIDGSVLRIILQDTPDPSDYPIIRIWTENFNIYGYSSNAKLHHGSLIGGDISLKYSH